MSLMGSRNHQFNTTMRDMHQEWSSVHCETWHVWRTWHWPTQYLLTSEYHPSDWVASLFEDTQAIAYCLMHAFAYCICLRIFNSSWLRLYVILLQHVLKGPSYEFTTLIIDAGCRFRISGQPSVYKHGCCLGRGTIG
jgi:hypothetical protein